MRTLLQALALLFFAVGGTGLFAGMSVRDGGELGSYNWFWLFFPTAYFLGCLSLKVRTRNPFAELDRLEREALRLMVSLPRTNRGTLSNPFPLPFEIFKPCPRCGAGNHHLLLDGPLHVLIGKKVRQRQCIKCEYRWFDESEQ